MRNILIKERYQHLSIKQYKDLILAQLESLKNYYSDVRLNRDYVQGMKELYTMVYKTLVSIEKSEDIGTLQMMNDILDKYSYGDFTQSGHGLILHMPDNIYKYICKVYNRNVAVNRKHRESQR